MALTPRPERYDCSVCGESEYGQPYTFDADRVCGDCLQNLFDNALTSEDNFPPRWASKRLNPEEFGLVLNPSYIKKYQEKAREWDVPANERVYCQNRPYGPLKGNHCNNYVGRINDSKAPQQCSKCRGYMCLKCRKCLGKGKSTAHSCDIDSQKKQQDDALKGLTKGVDYQLCPKCGVAAFIEAACNHVGCRCQAHFCFICGKQVDRTHHHFVAANASCPLYGQPKDRRAIWGRDVRIVEPHEMRDDDGMQAALFAGAGAGRSGHGQRMHWQLHDQNHPGRELLQEAANADLFGAGNFANARMAQWRRGPGGAGQSEGEMGPGGGGAGAMINPFGRGIGFRGGPAWFPPFGGGYRSGQGSRGPSNSYGSGFGGGGWGHHMLG